VQKRDRLHFARLFRGFPNDGVDPCLSGFLRATLSFLELFRFQFQSARREKLLLGGGQTGLVRIAAVAQPRRAN
jgi:hypothetical protein